jgi:hypothetical protein
MTSGGLFAPEALAGILLTNTMIGRDYAVRKLLETGMVVSMMGKTAMDTIFLLP